MTKLKHLSIVFSLAAVTLFLLSCEKKVSESEVQALQQQMAEQKELLEGIKSDVEGIKSALEGIRKGVEEARRPTPPPEQERTVSIDDDYIKGLLSAKLTLIEFSDFQCPFCERFYRETLPLIDREYIRTGKVRMIYRDFPLDNLHPDAQKAAEAAQCAGEEGKFWEMHDKLFENQKTLGVDQLKKYAKQLGLSPERFDDCLDSGKYLEETRKDLVAGQTAGVQGTPTFFLGYTRKDKTIQAMAIRGAQPYSAFKQAFDKMLQGKQK